MTGFIGTYLVIDLGSGSIEEVSLPEDFYRTFLSGYGLGAAVITARQKAGIDPLSAESYLGFCSGLLTGTGAYFSGRYMVVGKSPLTGGWGDANSGGFFSVELKRAGYDAVFFTGAAKKPVWVSLKDGAVEIRDAASLWGKDVIATEAAVKAELGTSRVQIAAIGPAGEKRSLIAGIVTDGGRIAARSGLGAVMGSKKLKALAVQGSGKVPIARPEAMKELNGLFLSEYKKSRLPDRLAARSMKFGGYMTNFLARIGKGGKPPAPSLIREGFRLYGTSALTVMGGITGDSPIRNWAGAATVDFPVSRLDNLGEKKLDAYKRRRYHCQACPLGCGAVISHGKGRYQGTEGHRPEYETIAAFGSLVLNDDLEAILEVNEMCNRAGIDTISMGGTVAFAVECFEEGLLDEAMTGGLTLGWGKAREIVRLVEMIIAREGIGDILADGTKRAAERIGKGAERFAVHAGGQELPMHDPRLDAGYGIAYQCEPTPGRHTIACFMSGMIMAVDAQFPKVATMVREAADREAQHLIWYTAGSLYMQLLNGSGVCQFGPFTGAYPLVEYLNLVTGWDLDADEYLTIGERILAVRKAFTAREGVRPADSRLHHRAAGSPPLTQGPTRGVRLDMERLEAGVYSLLGWDRATGGPSQEKLAALGLDELCGLRVAGAH